MKGGSLFEILEDKKLLGQSGITFIEGGNTAHFLSYAALYEEAWKALSALQLRGIQPGKELVFQIEDNRTFLITFWACILGAIIPIPLSVGQNEDHKLKVFNIWPLLDDPYLVTSKNIASRLQGLAADKGMEEVYSMLAGRIVEEKELLSSQQHGTLCPKGEDDIAFIQFSSGSTGNPKGVILTHRSLVANMRSISAAAGYTSQDAMISWMPLTHDMGLIGFHLNPLFCGMQQILIPPSVFIRRPDIWLEKASLYKATILCSPNFGYRYFIKHHNADLQKEWDLSNIRIIYNGAEPVSDKLCHEFLHCLLEYGLKSHAICPVYGLAEGTLAVTMSAPEDTLQSLTLDRTHLHVGARIAEPDPDDNGTTFVNVGKPVDNCLLRITDDQDRTLASEWIGHIQIRGATVTRGYYHNEEATKATITHDGWLRTGDLGFIKEGALYVTGRVKDILFINGQNFYPHDIERVTEEIEGIELNKVAVAGLFNEKTQTEELVVFAFYRGPLQAFVPLKNALKAVIGSKIGVEVSRVIPVREMPRTTSGKLQRFKLIDRLRKGDFTEVEEAMARLDLATHAIGSSAASSTPSSSRHREEVPSQRLQNIWEKVLQCEITDRSRNFFEMGGNSLKAAEIAMMIAKEFQVEFPAGRLYEMQTLQKMGEDLTAWSTHAYTPIPRQEKRDHYPVTSAQKRLYYTWETHKNAINYNIPVAFQLEGELSVDKLEDGLKKMVARHDTLRTSFHDRNGAGPETRVQQHVDLVLEYVECDIADTDNRIKEKVQPFDLARAPLFRSCLIQTAPRNHLLFLDFHHIISDGVSIYHFVRELFALYNGSAVEECPIQFKDYACREAEDGTAERLALQEAYWLGQLQGELPVLAMPLDDKRPVIFTGEGEKLDFDLGHLALQQLQQLATANDCTLHILLLTLYTILLSKYTGQEDHIVGIPVAGRRHPDLATLQGMFVNNLAILSNISGDETLSESIKKMKEKVTNALNNQDYPFEDLIKNIALRRDIGRSPVFDSMFIYQNMGLPDIKNTGLTLSRHNFDPGFSKYDISLEVFDDGRFLALAFEFSTSLFRRTTIARMAEHFRNLIDHALKVPESKISALSLLSEKEQQDLIGKFNDTAIPFPEDQTIHQLFQQEVEKTPDHIALEYKDHQLTYRQLNDRSTQLAVNLRQQGVVPNSIVGIHCERSLGLVVAILGVLKAGGCYLPIDAALPEERMQYLLADSRCRLVLTDGRLADAPFLVHSWKGTVLNIDEMDLTGSHTAGPLNISTARNLAYIIYTSGTTGKPKGVMIEHRSLVNYACWAAENYLQGEQMTFPLYTSVSFDLTVTSIFVPLITGNKIIIYEEDGQYPVLEKIVSDNKVDIIKMTPSHLRLLREYMRSPSGAASRIRKFIVGGEDLATRLARDLVTDFGKNVGIYNEYGPTEATVGCMIYRYKGEEDSMSVPIGTPAANTQIYLLDKYLQPVATGVYGEIYISGVGLARGYLFNETLTKEKFIPDPFTHGQKMYKTGDMARRLPDGNIEFAGRYDQQVKINGYRIELAEIGDHLARHEGITAALVTVKEDPQQQKHLYAYYTGSPSLQGSALRNYLSGKLPYYMIPARFINIEEIPLTKNGKPDYDRLPVPAKETTGPERKLPENEIEEISMKIWAEVLCEKDLQVTDNFFEWGGDSIKAVQIASRLSERGITVTVKDILTYHTVAQVSRHAVYTGIIKEYEQGPVEGQKDLTPIESWFFDRHFKNQNFYHQSLLFALHKKMDRSLLEASLKKLVEHHDGLRMNYDPAKNRLFYNRAHLEKGFTVEMQEAGEDPDTTLAEICRRIKNKVDITHSLLFSAALITQKGVPAFLFLTAHHLVIDGVAWRIILEDLYNVYSALEKGTTPELGRKTASLLDWEEKWRGYAGSPQLKKEADYWNKITAIAFRIPQDRQTDDWRSKNLARIKRRWTREKTTFLVKNAHKTYRTNVPILMNTALALTLKEWTGQTLFVIEQESHGRDREDIDVSRTIGWFTALYPVRIELTGGSIGHQVKAIKEQMNNIPLQGAGYGIHTYTDRPSRSTAGERAEIRFNYLGQFDREFDNDLFSYSNKYHGEETDPENDMSVKLEIDAWIAGGELIVELHYNPLAHEPLTAGSLMNNFLNHLDRILDHIKEEKDIHFTPSDFNSVALDQQELDALFD